MTGYTCCRNFCQYDWLGNERELENTLTKAIALCPGDILTIDLFDELKSAIQPEQINNNEEMSSLSLQDIEYHHVLRMLESVSGHKGKACDILKISRPRLQRILEKSGG